LRDFPSHESGTNLSPPKYLFVIILLFSLHHFPIINGVERNLFGLFFEASSCVKNLPHGVI
jgi:hypothetical protein